MDQPISTTIVSQRLTDNLISESLSLAHKYILQFLKYWIVVIVISLIASSILTYIDDSGILDMLFSNVFSAGVGISFCIFILKLVNETKVKPSTEEKSLSIFEWFQSENLKKILYIIVWGIVYGVAVVLGLLLFIIPWIYLANRLLFWNFYVINEDLDFITAMKKSWAITEWEVLYLIGQQLKLMWINLLGILPLFIGLIWTAPASAIAMGKVWTDMKERKSVNI